ncbi:MAG: Tfp pilus assembly protein PilF [Parcubacteria group bacterium Gr01-1014_2]|nr:MAG: Tfp pilus assembly protein PilF [Parcubacteria group bacterium Gr01-1014_2]
MSGGGEAGKAQVEFIFNPLAYASLFERFWTALKILILYLAKVFVPYRLSADYSYDQIPIVTNLFSSPSALVGLVVLGLMLRAIYRVSQRKVSVFVWALILFLMPYLVISNLIFPTGTIMGERLMYFSSLGAVMILALVIERLFKFSKRAGVIFLLILLVVYGLLTISQNRVWMSREALLTDIFKKSPDSVVAKTEYGILVLNEDKELAKKLSLEVYEKYPGYVQNLNLRAAVEIQEGNLKEAEKFLERALELRSKHQNTLQNLSRVYFTLGKYPETEERLKVLVSEYGGTGNVIFYALVQAKNNHFEQSRQTIYDFFGPDVKDESALKILRKEYKEVEEFFIFHKQ